MELAARGCGVAACAPPRGCRARVVSVAPMPPLRCAAAAAATPARFPALRRPRAVSRAAPPAPRRLRCRAQSGLVPHDGGGDGDGAPPLDPSQVASLPLPTARRRTQMTFTCNKCGVRSTRLVNPEALARGSVFVQCAFAQCGVWHKVADALDWWGDEYTDLQGKGQHTDGAQEQQQQ